MMSVKFLNSAQKLCRLESHWLDSKYIGSIQYSVGICAIKKILASIVNLLGPALPIFLYGIKSDPPSTSHDSSVESVIPKVMPKPRNKPLNLVLYVPADPDSYPSLSYSSSSELYDSSEDWHYKKIRHKKNINKRYRKTHLGDPIKKCAKFTAKLLTEA